MSIVVTLDQMQNAGVVLRLDGSKLSYAAPPGYMTEVRLQWLRNHRDEVITAIQVCSGQHEIAAGGDPEFDLDTASDDERELWAERAAIMEFDGELDRETAERLAMADIADRRNTNVTFP